MPTVKGRIPDLLGERNTFYRVVIPYIHANIIRLTPILSGDDTWLSAELVLWIPAYDDAANDTITNKNKVSERKAIDDLIIARLDKVLDLLTPWAGLTPTDRNTFRLFLRVESNTSQIVPSHAPASVVISQAHLSAKVKAIDPLNEEATTIPDGAFLVIWTGHVITDPEADHSGPILLGWSASIDCDLEIPENWIGKPALIQSYYVDKHKNKSGLSAFIPFTAI